MIRNLVLNADEAITKEDSIDITVTNEEITPNSSINIAEGPYLRINISDHGKGIPIEIQRKIFHPFFTTKKEGHGLGLASCYSIMKKHNGWIQFESTPNCGTKFTVLFPVITEKEIIDETSVNEIIWNEMEHKNVLIMDDEPSIRQFLSIVLKKKRV